MKKISYNSVVRKNINQFSGGTEAVLYTDGKKVYKIFREDYLVDSKMNLKIYKEKLAFLSKIKNLDLAILPKELIVKRKLFGDTLCGFTMDYIDNAVSLKDLSEDWCNTSYYFETLRDVSLGLKEIHNREEGILLRDASFGNVLLCKDENNHYTIPRFVDINGAMVGKFANRDAEDGVIFNKCYDFLKVRKNGVVFDKNLDRLTHLIHFLYFVFGNSIYELDMYEYDDMAEEIRSLRNIRSIILRLKDTDRSIPEIPYMYEFIDEDEIVLSKHS